MAYDGSLIFDTKIDNKGFKQGIDGIKSAASTSMKVVNGLMIAGAAAVVGIGVASIKAGSQFESGMSQVAATMGITVEQINAGDKSFQMLEKAALDMGKATQFSATDASEALNFLALAGYDAEKAVEALPKVLNLAAAGGLELGYASDLVTDSMSALGLETNQLDGFIDQLAVASQKSNTSVSQLGEAILTVGGTAKILKGGTVELSTQLGILADNGIKGSEGGTALRNVLLALSAPTNKQAAAMKELGIETYDASGKLRSTDDIFQDLNSTLGKMTDEEKTEVLSKLFNKVDLKAANALLAGSGERFAELSTAIEKSEGAAADMAATMNDNLLGKVELLKSAMEYLGIMIYKSVDGPLVAVIETMTGYVDKISAVMTSHDGLVEKMEMLGMSANEIEAELEKIPNGLEGAAQVMGEILADIALKLAESAPKFLELGIKMFTALIKGITSNMGAISSAAVTVITGFIEAYMTMVPQILVLGIELITKIIEGLAQAMPKLIPIAMEAINTVVNSLTTNLPKILEAGVKILLALIDGLAKTIPKLITAATEMMPQFIDTIIKALPQVIESGVEILSAVVDGIVTNLPLLITTAIDLIILIADKLIENIDMVVDAGIQIMLAVIDGIMDNLPKLVAEVPRIINAFASAIYSALPTILKAGIDILLEIIKGLINTIPTLVANIPQIIMAIVNVFTLYNWWNLGKSVITKLGTGISSMVGNIGNIARNLATNAITAIKNIFTQAPSVGSGFIRGIMSGISSLASTLISLGRTMATNALTAIKTAFSNAPSIGTNLVKGLWNGISNVTGWILDKISGFGTSIMNGIKGIFGIKSPSTKMRDEVGVMLGKGLAIGIDKSKGEATNSMAGMGKSILDMAKTINSDMKKENKKINEEIKQIEKDSLKAINDINAKAKEKKRKLTSEELEKIKSITEKSNKEVVELEKTLTTDLASQTKKGNIVIANLKQKLQDEILTIKKVAAGNNRELTEQEQKKILEITKKSNAEIAAAEHKALEDRNRVIQENSKQFLDNATKFAADKKAQGEMSLKDEVAYWDEISRIVHSKSEEYQVALKNKQKAINDINSAVVKANEDYSKRILDIDKKLIEDTNKLTEEYSKAYEKRVEDLLNVSGIFTEFVRKEEISGADLIASMQSQVDALDDFGDVMEALGGRVNNADLMTELGALGPKAIGELQSLNNMSDAELLKYVALYEERFRLATEQAGKELEPMLKDTEKHIQDLNEAAQKELDIVEKDWTKAIGDIVSGTEKELNSLKEVGANAVQGLESGMLSQESSLMATAQRIAANLTATIQAALDIHSPSRVMRDKVGKNVTKGIGVGLKSAMPELERDVKKEMEKLTNQMKTTVDIESSSVGRGIVAGNNNTKYTVVNGVEDAKETNMNFNGNIQAVFEVDGRQFATATAPYVSNEMQLINKRKGR